MFSMESEFYSLHNVAALEPAPGGGLYLRRFPREVHQALRALGRMVWEESSGVEIRFVAEDNAFHLSLDVEPFCLDQDGTYTYDVLIFRGDFFHSRRSVQVGKTNHITVNDISGALRHGIQGISPAALEGCRFSPKVWRVFIGRFTASLVGLSTYGLPCRAPLSAELPAKRWLAYGSSITNGGSPTMHHLSYIYQAAHRLGVDVLNQGLSGSCRCEPEIADYLASRQDWDIITLELGVNMRNEFTPEEFGKRAEYLVQTIACAHPAKPVVVISIFPNADLPPAARDANGDLPLRQLAYREALQRIVTETAGNVHFIDGADILREFRGLTTDLLHPGDFGHIEMGQRLAEKLAPLSG